MRRTTFSLPDDLAAALAREAHRRSVSASEVVRVALAKHLGLADDKPGELPFAAVGRSGQHGTARDMEKLQRSEWRGGPRRR